MIEGIEGEEIRTFMKLKLRTIIFIVTLIAVVVTLFSSVTASNRVSKDNLIEDTLETNRVYAQKVANATDEYLQTTLQTLAYSADQVAGYLTEENASELLYDEAERLLNQTSTFNSVVITSKDGEIIAASPESLKIIGEQLDSPAEQKALSEQQASITAPYVSLTGRLIVFISQPIYDDEGTYYGMVGGTIYLLSDNVLYDLLGEHYYQDGSYVYVMDKEARILYHPKLDRINDTAESNLIADEIAQGKSGSMQVINSKNIDMLAGYGYMPTAGWAVVSQRPVEAALQPAKDIRNEIIIKILPYTLILLVLIILISQIISYPLNKLAEYSKRIRNDKQEEELKSVRAWYYEANQLEKSLKNTYTFYRARVDHFSRQSFTDDLTSLPNRRMMQQMMDHWILNERPFSAVMLDIDHFKRVNDTYGHVVGDEVLIFLAEQMEEVTREHDMSCRYGGEEFYILMPDTTKDQAFNVADRLRKKLEETTSPSGEIITISLGISHYPEDASSIQDMIEVADNRLYKAKNKGRNQTVVEDE